MGVLGSTPGTTLRGQLPPNLTSDRPAWIWPVLGALDGTPQPVSGKKCPSWQFSEAPKQVPKQTGTTTSSFQNSKTLPFWYPIRFDTPSGAAKETPKRVPKCLVFRNQKLAILISHPFWYPFGFADKFRLCLTGGLLTSGFRKWMTRDWHVRERSPSKCCNLPVSEAQCLVGKSAKRAVTQRVSNAALANAALVLWI